MQYEVYVDKLFLMNLFFDCLMLVATGQILKLKTSSILVAVAGGVGSLGLCSVFLLPFRNAWSRFLYLGVLIFPLMLFIAFYKNSWKKKIQAGMVFVGISIVCGKLIEYIFCAVRTGFPVKFYGVVVAATGAVSIYYIKLIRKIYIELKEEESRYYTVLIRYHGRELLVEALYDTGNLLKDPFTGRYVHIIDKSVTESLFGDCTKVAMSERGMYLIPYQTIGKTGMLPVFTITEMLVSNGREEICVKRPVLGISNGEISSRNRYHMILNSGELKS